MSNDPTVPAGLPVLFADGIIEAHVRNGVARVTLGQAGGDGRGVATGQLIVPITQLPTILNSLARLAQELEARARQGAAANTTPPPAGGPAAPAAPDVPPGSAFRFS
ncbi:hypothetical protein LPC08_11035 [Roseomonas sp. OT10]|uniref:hypothetical protein n=1 Tax=Roseomonas cutis TaxID=2897332 RepID=UPI001E39394C|nr:hypothetical protein [Roseomonas sp. OT10]UFN51095.1 hypothetical protein LPC08_11035 [Roseomonas sp. OT10]